MQQCVLSLRRYITLHAPVKGLEPLRSHRVARTDRLLKRQQLIATL